MAKYNIVRVESGEIGEYRDTILGLWRANLKRGSDERFAWLYTRNPKVKTVTWLAQDTTTGKFVGCNSVYVRTVSLNGALLQMGTAVDFAVNKEHRVFGPALQLQKTIVADSAVVGVDFLLAWPNVAGKGVFLRAGYEPLAEVLSFVKPLRTAEKLQQLVKHELCARFAGSVFDACLCFQNFILGAAKPRGWSVRFYCSGEAVFGRYVTEFREAPQALMHRDGAFLDWRYSRFPVSPYEVCVLCDGSGRTRSVIVFSCERHVAIVSDLMFDGHDSLGCIVSSFTAYMRRRGMKTISLIALHNGLFEKRLRAVGFWRTSTERPCLFFAHSPEVKRTLVASVLHDEWRVMDGDLDL